MKDGHLVAPRDEVLYDPSSNESDTAFNESPHDQ